MRVMTQRCAVLHCREGADLAALFEAVEAARGRLAITDYAVRQTTLENVFIQLAGQQQHAQHAAQ